MPEIKLKHMGTVINGVIQRHSVETHILPNTHWRLPFEFVQGYEYIVDLDDGKVIKNKFTGETDQIEDGTLIEMFFSCPLNVWVKPKNHGGLFSD